MHGHARAAILGGMLPRGCSPSVGRLAVASAVASARAEVARRQAVALRGSDLTLFSPRLPHLFPRKVLARLLTSTYAAAMGVDEEEAHERLLQALAAPGLAEDLQRGISAALERKRGPRTPDDKLLDKVSRGIEKHGGHTKAAEATPAVSAVLVRLNLELGLAPEPMRATLATPRGAAALEEGLAALGAHLVKELLR